MEVKKHLKYRIDAISLFLVCIFFAIFISSVLLVSAVEEKIILFNISRGGYSENAVHFRIDEENWSYQSLIAKVIEIDYSDFIVIYDDYENHIRQVYIKGKIDPLPMVFGRYFNAGDFNRGKSLAVVGRNRIYDVFDKEGTDMIQLGDQIYEVIGITGFNLDTILDEMVIVNGDAHFVKAKNNVFILDGYSGKGPDYSLKVFESIKDNTASTSLNGAKVPVDKLDIKPTGIDRLLRTVISTTIINLLLIISYALCSAAISFEWISRKRRIIAVKRLVGWSNKRLILDLYRTFAGFAFTGIILGITVMIFIKPTITKPISILIVVILNVIFCWLVTILPAKKMLEISVAEVMR